MVATLRFDKWETPAGVTVATVDAASGILKTPGTVVQVITKRSDNRLTYSSSPSGDGNTIAELSLTITPKFSNSLLVMHWMINGELHQDNVFLIHKNGSLVTTSNEQGYNNSAGNSRWSGIASGFYDQNEDSTPSNWNIQYFCSAQSTSTVTFAPAVRSSSSGSYTLSLNRSIGSSGTDAYEAMVSTGVIYEIAQ